MNGQSPGTRLKEIFTLSGKLGLIGFGGPAVVIAMLEDEVVARRRWLTRQHYLDLIGATNLIPGPNSTEMLMHIGFIRAGALGLVVGGLCFIVPAAVISAVFAWIYVRYGALPEVAPFLSGIKPAVVAVIIGALWRLAKGSARTWQLAAIGLLVFAASMLRLGEILALFAGGLIGTIWLRYSQPRLSPPAETEAAGITGLLATCLALRPRLASATAAAGAATASTHLAGGVSLVKLGLFFLKVGAVMYGSGYVLIAFIQGGLVRDFGWLTQQQLLDAIAVGQFTPGPFLSTVTFIGYLLAGVPGAIVATVCVFLPAFFFVAAVNPLIPRLRRSAWLSAFLDAVNVSAVALIAAVAVKLAGSSLVTWPAWLIAIAAAVASVRWKVNAAWLVLGGAVAGWAVHVIQAM